MSRLLALSLLLLASACLGTVDDESDPAPMTERELCKVEAARTGTWPEGCSDADPVGPHSPRALPGGEP